MIKLYMRIKDRKIAFCLFSIVIMCTVYFATTNILPYAAAQGQTTTVIPPATQELITALEDIDHMRNLNPLKLTPEQLDKIITLLGDAKAEYEKKVNALGSVPLLQIADEIKSTKKQMLTGGLLPEEFDLKIQRIQNSFWVRRQSLNFENLGKVSKEMNAILTPKQIEIATKQEKEHYTKEGNDPAKATNAQLFNLYLADSFIGYSRMIPLLKEMRNAENKQ